MPSDVLPASGSPRSAAPSTAPSSASSPCSTMSPPWNRIPSAISRHSGVRRSRNSRSMAKCLNSSPCASRITATASRSDSIAMRCSYQPIASASSVSDAHMRANVRVCAGSSSGGSWYWSKPMAAQYGVPARPLASLGMRTLTLGRTGRQVSEVGFGAWQIGGDWGSVDEDAAMATLHAAADAGVTFFDTADVYGDGRSERLVGRLRRERPEITVATKMGRRLDQVVANYSPENFRAWNDRSRENLGMETLDLVQLHCPPTDLYYVPEVFEDLERMRDEGRMAAWGVSVERVEEALKAIEYDGCATVQIIFNPFRRRPASLFFGEAARRGVGIIVRVPLASGLLSGKYSRETTFSPDDHRNFNRHGEAFDVGETFAGVPFEVGLDAVEELKPLVPGDATLAQFTLRWILAHDAVSTVIPGARNPEQAQANAAAADLPAPDEPAMETVRRVYEERIPPPPHPPW